LIALELQQTEHLFRDLDESFWGSPIELDLELSEVNPARNCTSSSSTCTNAELPTSDIAKANSTDSKVQQQQRTPLASRKPPLARSSSLLAAPPVSPTIASGFVPQLGHYQRFTVVSAVEVEAPQRFSPKSGTPRSRGSEVQLTVRSVTDATQESKVILRDDWCNGIHAT
jgi:hypothetical protein